MSPNINTLSVLQHYFMILIMFTIIAIYFFNRSVQPLVPIFQKHSSVERIVTRYDHTLKTDDTQVAIHPPKTIYASTQIWHNLSWSILLRFDGCKFSNCVLKNSTQFEGIEDADVVLFASVKYTKRFPEIPWQIRQSQYWFMMSIESGAYPRHRFPVTYNNMFNGTVMYRKDATIYSPFGRVEKIEKLSGTLNFTAGKTKGAFAYVARCNSRHYKRMAIMEILANYINVDIYSNSCRRPHTSESPCPRLRTGSSPNCEAEVNRPYRFFLAFENSLCKDYITEKFWDRLQSSSYFVPIAMGGLSLEDYTSVAPPDSFLHVYNFTSVHKLGKYLQYLMNNDEAYNRYHQWRYEYNINTDRHASACELCKIANERPALPAITNISEWRNHTSLCSKYIDNS